MMETLKFCIQYIDDDVMQQLAPAITDVLKSGVGMSTKASAAELLVAFIFQIPQVVAPFAGKFMTPLLNGLSDRQAGVRRSYSTVSLVRERVDRFDALMICLGEKRSRFNREAFN